MHIEKPWGFEHIWAIQKDYVGKMLTIGPYQRLSLQYHKEKDETIYVVSGAVKIEFLDDFHKFREENLRSITLTVGESFHIHPGMIHRFSWEEWDDGLAPTILVEVSTNQLGDVVRLEDDYARV
jgi:mannose-6-phosphate isomerase-like protein (cupin superfamily)